jgi:NADH:ubiquinone oxidoreductase subunit E
MYMKAKLREIGKQGRGREGLLVVLKEAKEIYGCLTPEVIVELATGLDLPVGEVYGVATFYSFLSTRPRGRNIIRICKSIPCFLKDSQVIIDTIAGAIDIQPGETTVDNRFSFEFTNCIGACDKAPAMMVNHRVYGGLTPAEIARILAEHK